MKVWLRLEVWPDGKYSVTSAWPFRQRVEESNTRYGVTLDVPTEHEPMVAPAATIEVEPDESGRSI